jgi:hypothetical protein
VCLCVFVVVEELLSGIGRAEADSKSCGGVKRASRTMEYSSSSFPVQQSFCLVP